jgi:competence protein ComEC
VAVTLAAQVFTLPACLYYFRQFPVYFLFSNFPVVPLSTLILFAGLLLIIISPFTEAAALLGRAIYFSIKGMNEFVEWIDELPGAVITGLNQDLISVGLLYVFIISVCIIFIRKSKTTVFISLISFFLISTYSLFREIQLLRQDKLIVYRLRAGGVIDFVKGRSFFEWRDELQGMDAASLYSSRAFSEVDHDEGVISMKQEPVVRWKDWSICIIDSVSYPKIPVDSTCKVMILLRRKTRIPIMELNKIYRPSLVVFDGACSLWKIEKWRNECEKLHLPAYSIPHQGALVMKGGKPIP